MIFLSYSRKDWNEVRKLVGILIKEFGQDVFFLDIKDIEISNINFLKKISDALDKTTIFIAYITENYLSSEICQIEMNAYFLETLKNSKFKKIVPFYPSNIIDKAPLIYKGINSLIDEPIEKLIDVIIKIKKGEIITELKSPLQNETKLQNHFLNGIILSFLYYERSFANPKIKIFLNKLINWNKHFGDYNELLSKINFKWAQFQSTMPTISKINKNNQIIYEIDLIGVYFAGYKDDLQIIVNDKVGDRVFWTNIISETKYYNKERNADFVSCIFDKLVIEDHRGIIGEIDLKNIV